MESKSDVAGQQWPALKLTPAAIVLLLICGCAPAQKYYTSFADDAEVDATRALTIDVQEPDSPLLSVNPVIDSQERIQSSNAYQTNSLPPGTSPEAAAAGFVAGELIARSIMDSSANSSANNKLGPIETAIDFNTVNQAINGNFSPALTKTKYFSVVQSTDIDPEARILTIEPHLIFSNDLHYLRIKTDITITTSGRARKRTIYQNTFEYISAPVTQEGELNTIWTADQSKLLKATLDDGLTEIGKMFLFDFKRDKGAGSAIKTIKYHDQLSYHFARGTVLWEGDGRIVYRDLRNNLLSASNETN